MDAAAGWAARRRSTDCRASCSPMCSSMRRWRHGCMLSRAGAHSARKLEAGRATAVSRHRRVAPRRMAAAARRPSRRGPADLPALRGELRHRADAGRRPARHDAGGRHLPVAARRLRSAARRRAGHGAAGALRCAGAARATLRRADAGLPALRPAATALRWASQDRAKRGHRRHCHWACCSCCRRWPPSWRRGLRTSPLRRIAQGLSNQPCHRHRQRHRWPSPSSGRWPAPRPALRRGSRTAQLAVLASWIVPPAVLATGWFIALHRRVRASAGLAACLVIAMNALMALPFACQTLAPAMAAAARRHDRLCAQPRPRGLEPLSPGRSSSPCGGPPCWAW